MGAHIGAKLQQEKKPSKLFSKENYTKAFQKIRDLFKISLLRSTTPIEYLVFIVNLINMQISQAH